MYRTGEIYDDIKKTIIDIYLDYDIVGFPIDEACVCRKMGVALIPYTSYGKEDRKLLSRKNKETAEYNKYFEKVIIEREKEEIEAKRIEEENIRRHKLSELDEARQLLIGEGLIDEEQFIPVSDVIIEHQIKTVDEQQFTFEEAPSIDTIEEITIEQPKEDNVQVNEEISLIGDESVIVDLPDTPVSIQETKEETKEKPTNTATNKQKKKSVTKENKPKQKVEDTPITIEEEVTENKVTKPKEETRVEREKIPGKFIVKTPEGYFVAPNKYSENKNDAKIFLDFNLANDIKKERGGKVVKLS